MVVIDNVYYFQSAELADVKNAEKDWQRRGMYTGPPFGNLDEDLQVLLERYLDERGVNTALALFIPDYIDYKEQKEYISWLSSKSLTKSRTKVYLGTNMLQTSKNSSRHRA
jgi:complement component 1 Q subcomponent-binding protein, mitochondrial